MTLKKGDKAPAFTLPDTDRKMRSLSDFLSRKTVIAAIPGAFTPVCEAELCHFRDASADLASLDAQVVVMAVDSPFVNKAFAAANNVSYPILSDYSRETISAYGGLHHDFAGLSGYSAPKRSIFVIDRSGTVQYAWVSENPGAHPPYEEIQSALASLD